MGIWLVQLFLYRYFTVMVQVDVQVGSGVRWKALIETYLMFLSGILMCASEEDVLSRVIRTKSLVTFELRITLFD